MGLSDADAPAPAPASTYEWPTLAKLEEVQIAGEGVSVRQLRFSADGNWLAVRCEDASVRIWSALARAEMATLAHDWPVVAVEWMAGDTGVLTLGANGAVGKWMRTNNGRWHWAQILGLGAEAKPGAAPPAGPVGLACSKEQIAIALPDVGVRLWQWSTGSWREQRVIHKKGVTAVRFIHGGEALLGGTSDGVVWYSEVPNGTLRACEFFKGSIASIALDEDESRALVTMAAGDAHVLRIAKDEKIARERTLPPDGPARADVALGAFGGVFGGAAGAVLLGARARCALLWAREKGAAVAGLEHAEGAVVRAAAISPGLKAPQQGGGGEQAPALVTGTDDGTLTWWAPLELTDGKMVPVASVQPVKKRKMRDAPAASDGTGHAPSAEAQPAAGKPPRLTRARCRKAAYGGNRDAATQIMRDRYGDMVPAMSDGTARR